MPVGPGFIADFYASEVRLTVEVDGAINALKLASDERRDEKLTRLGYIVVRAWAEVVERGTAAAVGLVRAALVLR